MSNNNKINWADLKRLVRELKGLKVRSDPPEGENFQAVDNIYIEIVDGQPKLRVIGKDRQT